MIIKSMTRKTASFSQLFDYMQKGAGHFERASFFTHNLFSRDRESILKEYLENSDLLSKRKNRIFMFHEVLSIVRAKGISEEEQKRILTSIAKEYVELRASKNLVCGFLHDDQKTNLHFHFMISSNEIGQDRNLRLSKKDFNNIKKSFESHVLEHYPELEQVPTINKTKSAGKSSQKGEEMKRRTGKRPERDHIEKVLKSAFEASKSKSEFFNSLSSEKLEMYVRGKSTIGFLNTESGRKYRLKTLGLEEDFKAMSDRISLEIAASQSKEKHKPEVDDGMDTHEGDPITKEEKAEESLKRHRERMERAKAKEKTKGKWWSWIEGITSTVNSDVDVIIKWIWKTYKSTRFWRWMKRTIL